MSEEDTGKKKVLIVDDNYETVNYLRSALELTRNSYTVIGVPSAEEAWLELLAGDIDLVIIDLRLPGMSGAELMRRVSKRFPRLPSIVMSGYSLEWMKRETAGLSVFHLFEKPLDTDQLLEVVDAAVFGKKQTTIKTNFLAIPDAEVDLSDRLRRRLQQLRQETGARRLLLGTLSGRLIFAVGEALEEIDEQGLTALVGENLHDSLNLAEAMGSEDVLTVQVQTSQRYEVYMANLGRFFFVTLFYPAQSQRARIGTIWVFLQRAIRDLIPLLPPVDMQKDAVPSPIKVSGGSAPVEPVPAPQTLEPGGKTKRKQPLEPEPEGATSGPPLSLEEALAQGLVPETLFGTLSTPEATATPSGERLELGSVEEIDLFADLPEESFDDLASFLDLTAEKEAAPEEAEAFWKGIVTGDTEGEADDDLIDEALQTGILINEQLEEKKDANPDDRSHDEQNALED